MGTGGRVNLTEDDQGGGVVRQMLAIDDEGKGAGIDESQKSKFESRKRNFKF